MKASVGLVDAVTPAGTSGLTTGCNDQSLAARLANCSFTLSCAGWAYNQLNGKRITAGTAKRIETPNALRQQLPFLTAGGLHRRLRPRRRGTDRAPAASNCRA